MSVVVILTLVSFGITLVGPPRRTKGRIMAHICICGTDSDLHDQYCDEPDCQTGQHWPPLCCRDCPCHSYTDAHPLLRVLQAIADGDIGFSWVPHSVPHSSGTSSLRSSSLRHGSQLRLRWWESGTRGRRLTRQERRIALACIEDGLAHHSYLYGRFGVRGRLALTAAGRTRLNGGLDAE